MRERIIYFAEKICASCNPADVYYELIEFFEKLDFLVGKVNVLEQIWRLNGDSKLLLEIANILLKVENDPKVAYKFYKEYFSQQSNDALIEFLNIHNQINNLESVDDKDCSLYKSSELALLYGKFAVYIVILYLLSIKKEYQLLLEVESYLERVRSEIEEFVLNSVRTDYPELEQIQDDVKILSEILSQVKHHNDINYLAIKFNQKNEQAYINILDDLLTYKNYKEALEFYNNKYIQAFDKIQVDSISSICWEFVDVFGKRFDFYKSVYYQKLALEFELEA